VSTAPPPVSAAGRVPGVEPIIFIQYVVQGEDTLYRITEKQKTSIELMAVHGIDAGDLVPGATLSLPVANPNYCAASTPYVVRPGDTIYAIANRFNTTIQRLAQLNNLGADYRIDITNILCVG
jgi:LysM repeat protein